LPLAGHLKAKRPFWNSIVSNHPGAKLLNLNEFEISAPQYSTHCSPAGNCDVLDIVVHKKVRLSEVIVSEILESDHMLIIFHSLDHIKLGILRKRLTNSKIGSGFKAWPLY
jgi:hypothetical protein